MLSNNTEAPAAPGHPEPARAEMPVPPPNPRGIIEVASTGTGGTNDTSGTDKPPGVCDPGDPANDC